MQQNSNKTLGKVAERTLRPTCRSVRSVTL